jgi:hypothetical protein
VAFCVAPKIAPNAECRANLFPRLKERPWDE